MDIGAVRACLGDSLQRTLALMTSKLESSTSLLVDVNASLLERHGKLLRPMLCLLVASACGGIGEDSIRYAAASELMHTASLLHDDVIDNSATRRGRPTVYSRLGATGSVLVGDFWLVRCIDCILDGEKESGKVIRLFAKTMSDLTEGELLQMDKASRGDTTEDDYYRIVYAKTASLFEVAARSGAISAGASSRVQEAAATFAREMGIAFQIEDDIFDYQEDGSRLGKPVGVDLMERKITLPLLCAPLQTTAPSASMSSNTQAGTAIWMRFRRPCWMSN